MASNASQSGRQGSFLAKVRPLTASERLSREQQTRAMIEKARQVVEGKPKRYTRKKPLVPTAAE